MSVRVVDAHHHVWLYDAAEYEWLDDSMRALRRDFLPDQLLVEMRLSGVDAAVTVQARQSVEETKWLLELAAQQEATAGVVGWVPLMDADVERVIEGLLPNAKLKGMRHVLQGEAKEYMLAAEFGRGIDALTRAGLTYDLLLHEGQLEAATELVDRHPRQVFVLDHLAKPKIKAREVEPWAGRLTELARRENVSCKLSGMVTEADWGGWSAASLRPYFEVALEAFGAGRLMFGSDWPVCLVASSYGRWVGAVKNALVGLSEDEQAAVMGGNAVRVYGLGSDQGAGD